MKENNKICMLFIFILLFVFLLIRVNAFASEMDLIDYYLEKYGDYNNNFYCLSSSNHGESVSFCTFSLSPVEYDFVHVFCDENSLSQCSYYRLKGESNTWKKIENDFNKIEIYKFRNNIVTDKIGNNISTSILVTNYDYINSNFPICYIPSYDIFNDEDKLFNYLDSISYKSFCDIEQLIGYDSNIPTPKNLEVYFNRKLESPFNIGDMHSPINIKWDVPEDEDYSDYTLEAYIDVNYNKINSLGGIGTKPTVLNTGRVKLYEENASHCQMNISDTCEGWSALSEKFDTSVWGITGNYLDLWIRYVDSGGNYGNWVKVHITPSNSGSVIKFGGTNTTINKGYEEISGEDNTTKVDDSQYGDKYFVSTKDNGFSESVTNLKSQFGDLISFFSSLFSFLPEEVWELLVAFIGAGCLVALFKFIRG